MRARTFVGKVALPVCLLMSFGSMARASDDTVDASTLTCDKLTADYKPMDGSIGILAWMAGYHATQEQGTIVDWGQINKAADQTLAFCAGHNNVGIMSASEGFMGEKIGAPGADAADIAVIKCKSVRALKNFSDTIMWLAGYHASYNKDSTIIDWNKMSRELNQILTFCDGNPETGLITASEKFMSEPE